MPTRAREMCVYSPRLAKVAAARRHGDRETLSAPNTRPRHRSRDIWPYTFTPPPPQNLADAAAAVRRQTLGQVNRNRVGGRPDSEIKTSPGPESSMRFYANAVVVRPLRLFDMTPQRKVYRTAIYATPVSCIGRCLCNCRNRGKP